MSAFQNRLNLQRQRATERARVMQASVERRQLLLFMGKTAAMILGVVGLVVVGISLA